MLLEVHSLNKRYGAVVVANDVSLELEEGEALGIIGPNGAGKSSLFNLLTGSVAADSGSVTLDGEDISQLHARHRVLRGIGRSYQIPKPFEHMTVFENVSVAGCYGRNESEAAIKNDMIDILFQTGLLPKANLPAGGLSLLERKRLEMARALATKPRLLLLDEIAGGLTDAECQSLISTIQDVHASGVTLIWIEHVTHALLAVVSRLIAIDFGKIIAQGHPDAVMASENVQRIYLGIA